MPIRAARKAGAAGHAFIPLAIADA